MTFQRVGWGADTSGDPEGGAVAELQRYVGAVPDGFYGLQTFSGVHQRLAHDRKRINELETEIQRILAGRGDDPAPVDTSPTRSDRVPELIVTNRTEGALTDARVRKMVSIAQEYRDRFISDHWPHFEIRFGSQRTDGGPWEIEMRRRSGLTGALGYHSFRTVPGSNTGDVDPFAIVGVEEPGGVALKTLIHELELVADAGVNQIARRTDDISEYVEFADPVQGDPGPMVQGEETINIVTPNWSNHHADGDFDIMGLVTSPWEIRPGGFSIQLDHRTKQFSHRLQGNRVRSASERSGAPKYLPAHAFELPVAAARAMLEDAA